MTLPELRSEVARLVGIAREVEAKATPGPWQVAPELPTVVVQDEPAQSKRTICGCTTPIVKAETNARVIALSRNAFPGLIEAAERLSKRECRKCGLSGTIPTDGVRGYRDCRDCIELREDLEHFRATFTKALGGRVDGEI